jgi:malate dehydrogenase
MSLIGAQDVEAAAGGVLDVEPGDIVTPLARDRAAELGVRIVVPDREAAGSTSSSSGPAPSTSGAATPRPDRSSGTNLREPSAPRGADARTTNSLFRRGAPPTPDLRLGGTQAVDGARRRGLRAAVVGAGHVGSIATVRLAESDLLDEVVLIDLVEGLAAGVALDLWHDASIAGFSTRIRGSEDMAALAGVDYVIITAGKPRTPGMTRTDLTAANAAVVGPVAEQVAAHAPHSVIVVVTNPLEEMTHLAQVRSGFPARRVLGMAGVLDSARFCSLVGLTGVAQPREVEAFALGSHGPEMVVPLSQAVVNGKPLSTLLPADQLSAIVERTRDSGAEVVSMLKTGSAYFAPGHCAALMVTTMASGSGQVLACAVDPAGAYGIRDTRVGVPVTLARDGLKDVVVLDLLPGELDELRGAADRLRTRIHEVA